jgi:ribosome recycling factor
MRGNVARSAARALELPSSQSTSRLSFFVPCSTPLTFRSGRGTCTCLHNSPTHGQAFAAARSTTQGVRRAIHTTRPLYKQKGGKQNSKSNVVHASARADAANNDPFDFSTLETSISSITDKLKDDLSKIQKGGRITTELIENLRVELKTAAGGGGGGVSEEDSIGAKKSKSGGGKKNKPGGQPKATEMVKVGDLAQVVPRGGRSMVILVGEEAHVKPITSALLASPHNLNPTPDSHAPLELQLPVPPPTKESREQAGKEAGKAGERASEKVKEARGSMQKTLRAMEVAKTVRSDDIVKARDTMEAKVKEAQGEVKKIVDGARKALES